ncbi:MAG: hypothetical protein M3R25_07395 [Bacteroidota bacterium]|nr:hypothetical protein [Bacteroidota bacterium]
MTTTRDTLMPILGTLYPWRRRIIRFTAAVFILSVLFSLLMKNYYQGKTVFYAASQDLFKPEKIFGNSSQDMFYYGSGEDIDRILTVGNSHEIIDYLIDSFDLWSVYKIKEGTSIARFKMRKAFRENYNILLTKQDALELTVEDHDPDRASNLANAARNLIDIRVKSIIQNSQTALSSSYQRAIETKEKIVQNTLDSLTLYRNRTGIYDPEGQSEYLAARLTDITNTVERERATLESFKAGKLSPKLRDTIPILEAKIAGYQRELNLLNSTDTSVMFSLPRFNANRGKIEMLQSKYERSSDQISYDLEKLKFYNAALEIDVSTLHVIEQAEVPLYKHRPRRSVIVLAVTLAAFLFGIASALIIESYRQMDWKSMQSRP